MVSVLILSASILFQAAAAILALSLIRITGKKVTWILICLSLILMSTRRIIPLFMLFNSPGYSIDVLNEFIGLALSIVMFAGIWGIGPIFREQKRTERDLAAQKESLAVTLKSIGDGVITTDAGGAVSFLNKAAEDLTGWPLAEARGKPLAEVFKLVDEQSLQPLDGGGSAETANGGLLVSRQGSRRVIEGSCAPIRGGDETPVGAVRVFRDMTEKERLIEASQKNQRLESLGVLAGGIAHDFNNLLGGIFGYIGLALAKCEQAQVSGFLEKAYGAMDRARALSLQLLTFAKGGTPVRSVGSLFPFVQETASFALSGSNVSCRCQVQEDLRPCSFDKNQIGQVIDNIVINAKQAMPAGGTIDILARNLRLKKGEHPPLPAGDYVKISIVDRGIGIPQGLLPRIFDPFFTTKQQGHGLGLATSYSIVNRHNGTIEVESEIGKGSAFHVILPASAAVAGRQDGGAPKSHRGSGVFVVMDDEETLQDTVASYLELFGYTVVSLKDGEQVIDFLSSAAGRSAKGVILDLTVPGGMGGKETVASIRRSGNPIPVFVSSGYAEDQVVADPGAFGFSASLPKPFHKEELIDLLNAHIGSTPSSESEAEN